MPDLKAWLLSIQLLDFPTTFNTSIIWWMHEKGETNAMVMYFSVPEPPSRQDLNKNGHIGVDIDQDILVVGMAQLHITV